MNVNYECGFCGRGFDNKKDCESHEKVCRFREVTVKRICLYAECPVDAYHYVFGVDEEDWDYVRLENIEEDTVDTVECADDGTDYEIFTTDLSEKHERELRLKLLDQALMELPCFIANYTQLIQSAEKLKKELE